MENAKHGEQWRTTLAAYAAPVIGKLLVRDVQQAHILKILEPIWTTKTETASRLRGRIEKVLDYASAHEEACCMTRLISAPIRPLGRQIRNSSIDLTASGQARQATESRQAKPQAGSYRWPLWRIGIGETKYMDPLVCQA